jgi:hypothetical protein
MTGVAVIVVSFNRPNLLRQALASIQGADQIIVADDGSDFDVRGSYELVANPPIPPIERLRQPRLGGLLNRALRLVRQPVVTYLNDDDLFATDWIATVSRFFAQSDAHMCRGDWLVYGKARNSFPPEAGWCITTGNYAYRTSCATEEQCWWGEQTVGSHDGVMLTDYLNRHGMKPGGWDVPHIGMAGWRREHASNMAHFTQSEGGYMAGADKMFALGTRE